MLLFRCTFAAVVLAITGMACEAQQIAIIERVWNSSSHADRSYRALERSRTRINKPMFIGAGDFYYQLVVENRWKKAQVGNCFFKPPSVQRFLNTTTLDAEFLDPGAAAETIKTLPIFVMGINIDASTGSRRTGCNVRPTRIQYWPLKRYEGTKADADGEEYALWFSSTLAQSTDLSPFAAIIKAIVAVPTIAGVIPPGISDATGKVADALAAVTTSPSAFKDLKLAAAQDGKAVLHVVIRKPGNSGDYSDEGEVRVYVKRIGSLILEKATTVGRILSLPVRGDRFRAKFLAAHEPAKKKFDLKTSDGIGALKTMCTELRRYASDDMTLSTIDAALVRRSFLIEQGYDTAISSDAATYAADCWNQTDEDFVRAAVIPEFSPTIEKFGTMQ